MTYQQLPTAIDPPTYEQQPNAESVQVPMVEYNPMEMQQPYVQYPPPQQPYTIGQEGYSYQNCPPQIPVQPEQSSQSYQPKGHVAQTIVLGPEPTVCYCPTCKQPVQTKLKKIPSPVQYVLVFMTWFCLIFFAFLWLTCPCLKETYHVCTRCQQNIGKKGDIVAIE